ncbi:PREDICTED: mas-related G-protein coupled receptor member H-like [Ficedula albicollis]|uniref:mas-related G-protein coupled receptor member H-like n=1 Tax=Ficedula albicollis TaxID=59894 RepID=UPI0007AD9145|nr:PREDICTED: mas-related G-protein coupled receptor member H-like [Ficedula albicollis]
MAHTAEIPKFPLASGNDLCSINVSDVAIYSVTLLICLCGLAGNGAVLWLQCRKSVIGYIFNQAFDEFFFLLFMVPSNLLFLLEDVSCSIIMPPVYLSFLFQLSVVSYNMGLYRLMFINTKRCRSIRYQLSGHIPQSMWWVAMRALQWAFFYAVIALNPTITSLCQTYEHKHCWGAVISLYTLNFFLFAAPLAISSTIFFIKAKCALQQQHPERLDIVVFFTALFILPVSICNFLQQIHYMTVSSQVVLLLICIHSSTKPFIYFLAGKWLRHCWSLLRDCLQTISNKPKESTACSNGAAMDTGL